LKPVLSTINKESRLAALSSYNILDTGEEKDFDDLTTLASAICQTPIAFISLIDNKREWFKSRRGIAETETPAELSFSAFTIASDNDIMIVEDLSRDERFVENPLVKGNNSITFYAGVPLVNDDGFALGSLCVIDQKQKKLSDEQTAALKIIAKQVVDKLELRKKAKANEKMNQELLDSNLVIKKFAAMAAHDIKNPLSTILLSAQALQTRVGALGDKNLSKLIDINVTSTKQLINMLDDMLAYSKSPELLFTQKQTVDFSDVLKNVIKFITVPANFSIKLPLQKHALTIPVIALEQIMSNLLTNAIRYNDKEQGQIDIRYSEDEEYYHFEVEDNGLGIAPEYHEKIFNNNFILNVKDRFEQKGNGIGLSTVKELVKAVKGKIRVHSVVGAHTTFTISMPK
jgi:signal transduction histidine kinase